MNDEKLYIRRCMWYEFQQKKNAAKNMRVLKASKCLICSVLKVLYPIIFVNIDFDGSKVTDHALKYCEN